MNLSIQIPAWTPKIRKLQYDCNYFHFIRYAGLNNMNISLTYPDTKEVWAPRNGTWMSMTVNGKQLVVDFSDKWEEGLKRFDEYEKYIKIQYNIGHDCSQFKRLFPSMPALDIRNYDHLMTFWDMVQQGNFYLANGDTILSCQRAHTRALERRTNVQALLKKTYKYYADIELTNQLTMWNKHKDCLVAVVVPGAQNHMIDRQHLEQIALGVCTIAPSLDTVLCYWKKLENGIHFIQCKDDYSDLLEKIEWCRNHREECRIIGQNARQFFLDFCAPKPYWKWLQSIVEG